MPSFAMPSTRQPISVWHTCETTRVSNWQHGPSCPTSTLQNPHEASGQECPLGVAEKTRKLMVVVTLCALARLLRSLNRFVWGQSIWKPARRWTDIFFRALWPFLDQLLPSCMNGNCKGVDVVSIFHSGSGNHHRWRTHCKFMAWAPLLNYTLSSRPEILWNVGFKGPFKSPFLALTNKLVVFRSLLSGFFFLD